MFIDMARLLIVFLIGFSTASTFAQCPQEELLKNAENSTVKIYFLNKNDVAFFAEETLASTIPTPGSYALGEMFFASQETADSIRLIKNEISNGVACISFAGWVAKDHVIEGIYPISVGDVVAQYGNYFDRTGPAATDLNTNNRLGLKALTRPEAGTFTPLVAPGNNSAEADVKGIDMAKFLWRFVYDAAEADGELWYLVGGRSALLTTYNTSNPIMDPRYSIEAQHILFGWIKAADTSPWPTALALECNASELAVEERLAQDKPCTIFKNSSENYAEENILAQENFELWKAYQQNPTASDLLARPQPFGWDPMIPRYHVQGSNREQSGWYKVATLGDLDAPVDAGSIAEELKIYNQLLTELLTIHLVFIVDRSGSMEDEIQSVSAFLTQLAEEIAALRKGINPDSAEGKLSGQVEVKVSLLSFVDTVTPVFIKNTLPDDIEAIKKAMQPANIFNNTGSGYEYIHMALKAALDPQVLPQDVFAQRHLVLITDEPGDQTSTIDEEGIYTLMQQQLAAGFTRLGISDAPTEEEIHNYTRLWTLYTEGSALSVLQGNVDRLTIPERIIQIADFAKQSSDTQKTAIRALLLDTIADSTKRAEELTTALSGRSSTTGSTPALLKNTSLVGARLRQAAIDDLLAKYPGTDLSVLDTAFVEGYTNLELAGLSQPAFVPVITLSEAELTSLFIFVQDVNYYLDTALQGKGRIPPENFMTVLFFAMYAYVTNNAELIEKFETNMNEFVIEAQKWFSDETNLDSNLANILQQSGSVLELSKSPLLTRSARELETMSEQEVAVEAEVLALKSQCLNLVRKNKTIPMTYQECATHSAQDKKWEYVPPGGREGYYYIPQTMMP